VTNEPVAWAAGALGYNTTQASALTGVVAIGTAVGAVVASMRMRLDKAGLSFEKVARFNLQ